MLMTLDGAPRSAWALQGLLTGTVHLFTVCESELLARALLAARNTHHPHLEACRVIPITLAATLTTGDTACTSAK